MKNWRVWEWIFRSPKASPVGVPDDRWQDHGFYGLPAGRKTEVEMAILREVEKLHKRVVYLRRNKKRFTHVLKDLLALQNLRLRIDTGASVSHEEIKPFLGEA